MAAWIAKSSEVPWSCEHGGLSWGSMDLVHLCLSVPFWHACDLIRKGIDQTDPQPRWWSAASKMRSLELIADTQCADESATLVSKFGRNAKRGLPFRKMQQPASQVSSWLTLQACV